MELIDKISNGYKKSDIGIIPEDWSELVSFDELFNFNGGFSASRNQLSNKGICYLHYGDIHKSKKTYIDIKNEFYEIPKLNIQLNKVSKNMLLEDGDVVFVDASEDNDGISKYVVVDNVNKIDFISGLHTIVAKSKDDYLDKTFKRYCFQNTLIKRQFLYYAAGTKVTGINKTNIKKVLMSIPPMSEQKAIGEVLSDIDQLIMTLEELIEKKQLIKQGTMQELLSGHKRLPGFNRKWETTTIGSMGSAFSGLSGKNKMDFQNGNKPYIPFLNIMNNTVIKMDDLGYVKISSSEYQNSVRSGDLFFNTSSETPEEVGMCSVLLEDVQELYLNSFCFGFRIYNQNLYDPLFFAYFFRSTEGRKLFYSLAQGATRYNLSKNAFYKIEIKHPLIDEQKAIANILYDMDYEIETLMQKLEKYKTLKLGIMHELLTGRIRLKSRLIKDDNKVSRFNYNETSNYSKIAESSIEYK